ncbi:MAG TPA: VTT domain-containing protein [Symbiobacteriaceae bacterium]|nr:VTT domain-containing protein [Symbiobacteriaceae bacterium]
MKRLLMALAALAGVLLAIFFAVDGLGIRILSDPTPWLARGGPGAAAAGVGLLIADVLLPVPSSLVMVAHGARFGVWLGAALSLAGGLGGALCGFAIGRRGGALLARFVTDAEREQAERLLARWGALAVVITRPVPIVAESVAILAGASGMGWGKLILAAIVGLLPPAILYALAGALAGGHPSP